MSFTGKCATHSSQLVKPHTVATKRKRTQTKRVRDKRFTIFSNLVSILNRYARSAQAARLEDHSRCPPRTQELRCCSVSVRSLAAILHYFLYRHFQSAVSPWPGALVVGGHIQAVGQNGPTRLLLVVRVPSDSEKAELSVLVVSIDSEKASAHLPAYTTAYVMFNTIIALPASQ